MPESVLSHQQILEGRVDEGECHAERQASASILAGAIESGAESEWSNSPSTGQDHPRRSSGHGEGGAAPLRKTFAPKYRKVFVRA